MENKHFDISIIGAGNMAFRLGIALAEAGHRIGKIWCRRPSEGEKLAKILSSYGDRTQYFSELSALRNSEIIIIAVSDNAIPEVAKQLSDTFDTERQRGEVSVFHTSGATPIDALAPLSDKGIHCGVLYPMMTLSRGKNVNFSEVPLLLEQSDQLTMSQMEHIAQSLDCQYFFCDSNKRLKMHCAAVFASNFINYTLSLAFEIAGDKASYLIPTAIESVRKACLTHPDLTQTGPALRGDTATMEKHICLLQQANMKEQEEIYKLISKNIPGRVKNR